MGADNPRSIVGQYLTVLQVEMRPNTARLYQTAILRFRDYCTNHSPALFLPESWDWGDVGVQSLERYLHQSSREQGWSANTTHAHLTAIRHFFRYLSRSGYLNRNPIQHYTLKKTGNPPRFSEVGPDELGARLQQLPSDTPEQLIQCLLLELTYSTGVSVAQLCRVENLEPLPQSGSLRIHFSKRLPLERPLGTRGLSLLERYLKVRQHSTGHRQPATSHQCPPFWVDDKGKPLSPAKLKQLLSAPLLKIGLPHANALRDAGLQHFSEAGADMRSLQKFRGLKRLQRVQDCKNPAFGELQDRLFSRHPRTTGPDSERGLPD